MITKLTTRSSFRDYADTLSDLREFKTSGNLYGVSYAEGGPYSTGRLDPEWFPSFHRADYVVYSYGTPIAWHTGPWATADGDWVMPEDRYSVTTTRHQNKIHVALTTLGVL